MLLIGPIQSVPDGRFVFLDDITTQHSTDLNLTQAVYRPRLCVNPLCDIATVSTYHGDNYLLTMVTSI